MKRFLKNNLPLFLLALVLLTVCASATAEYRDITLGDKGKDVLAIKQRLHELGYMRSVGKSDAYQQGTADQVAAFMARYGIYETDATVQVQELLFAEDARPAAAPIVYSDQLLIAPVPLDSLPATDPDGTLTDKSAEPFIHKDEENGLWYWIGPNLSVEIKRMNDRLTNLTWFETRVRVSGGNTMKTFFSDEKASGKVTQYPLTIAEDHDAVVAFSDDFFGWRRNAKKKEGILIKNGVVYSDSTLPEKNATQFPPLDVIALMPDGSLECFGAREHTAQEYLDMGVTQTYAFGPILVHDGELVTGWSFADSDAENPRSGIGCFGPNDYIIISVKGRNSESEGCSIPWVGHRMHELGVTEALNLDGGNSVMLIFDGEMINRSKKITNSSIRTTVSVLGFTAN